MSSFGALVLQAFAMQSGRSTCVTLILLGLDSCSLCGTVLWWDLWGLAAFRSLFCCSPVLQLPESQPGACLLFVSGIPALLGTGCLPHVPALSSLSPLPCLALPPHLSVPVWQLSLWIFAGLWVYEVAGANTLCTSRCRFCLAL